MKAVTEHSLVGRSGELGVLRRLLGARAGASGVALIEGEAGIGKTRLTRALLDEAASKGFRVLYGVAEELEHARAFGGVIRALDLSCEDLDAERATIRQLLTAPATPESGYRICEEICDYLERAAMHSPLLLALDDLHWADPFTLLLLRNAQRRLAHVPGCIIGTLRPAPRYPELDRVIDALIREGAELIRLGPLDGRDVDVLVAATLQAPPGPKLRSAAAGAGGNPLFVLELLAGLEEEGALVVDASGAELVERILPPSMRLTILRRLSFLPERTLEGLRLASVLGTGFTLADLSHVTGRPVVELASSLEPALRAGVVGESGERMSFRHDVIRESLYEDMPLSTRKALHVEVALKLDAAGAPVAQVATHASLGAEPGDSKAVGIIVRAARESVSAETSIEFLRRAIELVPAASPERDRFEAQVAAWSVFAGRRDEAEVIARRLLARPLVPLAEAAARAALCHSLSTLGRYDDARREMERVLGVQGVDAEELEPVMGDIATLSFLAGDVESAAVWAQRCLDAGRRRGHEFLLCLGHLTLCLVRTGSGDLDAARDHGERSVVLARRVFELNQGRPTAHLAYVAALIECDELDGALEITREGRGLAGEFGVAHVPMYQWWLTVLRYLSGAFDDAIAEAEAGFEMMDETGAVALVCLPLAVLARIALHRNDIASAERWVAQGEQILDRAGWSVGGEWIAWARSLVLEAAGDSAAACDCLAAAWAASAPDKFLASASLIAPDLVRLAVGVGDVARARDVSALMQQRAARASVPNIRGTALRCEGIAGGDAAMLRAAVEELRRGHRPVALAAACEDVGDAEHLHEAAEIYERVGATRDVGRLEAALREMGVRRGRRGARTRATSGWEALTKTELEVVRLVAEGLSNPEVAARLFISRRTVRSHLEHVYAKLGIASRVELAIFAATR